VPVSRQHRDDEARSRGLGVATAVGEEICGRGTSLWLAGWSDNTGAAGLQRWSLGN